MRLPYFWQSSTGHSLQNMPLVGGVFRNLHSKWNHGVKSPTIRHSIRELCTSPLYITHSCLMTITSRVKFPHVIWNQRQIVAPCLVCAFHLYSRLNFPQIKCRSHSLPQLTSLGVSLRLTNINRISTCLMR